MASAAEHYKALYTFDPSAQHPGTDPTTAMVSDAAGNLYGTDGGNIKGGGGAVYQLLRQGHKYIYHEIKVFHNNDGATPVGRLVIDAAGNLYGTTRAGGANPRYGTIYELSPADGGKQWNLTTLYNFTSESYGSSGLVMDASGNLFGANFYGGANHLGTLFELSPARTGPWTYKVIHDFTSAEGGDPNTQLVLDSSGNLYGGLYTVDGTYSGIFELSPGPDGAWTESNLHTFDGATDGAQPSGPLVFDPAGNLYGSNSAGGQYGAGTAFELTPIAGGWNFSVIHAFGQSYLTDGYYPEGGVILDSKGNLYGVTNAVGPTAGNVFELSPSADGQWTETILYSFTDKADGGYPVAGLFRNSAGDLFGSVQEGGIVIPALCPLGCGVIFELAP
jgi:hypothetical protein